MTNIVNFNQKPANDYKEPPAFNLPPVTSALVGVMVAIYLVLAVVPLQAVQEFVAQWCVFYPALLAPPAPQAFTSLMAYGFLHANFMHVASNVIMLMALGTAVERSLGPRKMLALFLVGTVVGALAQTVVDWGSTTPMVGSSAGIAALFGAYIMMQPTAEARRKMAAVLGLLFIVTALLFMPLGGDRLAWAAHLGGLAAGLLQTGLWLNRKL